jgi:two-component system sensor histidine kinase/response regulator
MPNTFESAELLAQVDHDMEFLGETVELLSTDGPTLLAQIRAEGDAGDAAAVARDAHALKGMISNFCSPLTVAAALAVEQIGRKGDLAPLPAALATLQSRLGALIAELNEFLAEGDK